MKYSPAIRMIAPQLHNNNMDEFHRHKVEPKKLPTDWHCRKYKCRLN